MPISDHRLREIEDRLRAASSGPWWVQDIPGTDDVRVVAQNEQNGLLFQVAQPFTPHGQREANAELIAHSPEDLADLLEEVKRLRTTARPVAVNPNYWPDAPKQRSSF